MRNTVAGLVGRGLRDRRWAFALFVMLVGWAETVRAQNIISVPFTNGFVGTRGSSAGTANNVLTYATLGIARTFFIQSSSTSTFELQGNDIPGTLRIVRVDGSTLDIPASANWRNSGGSTFLIGILPRPLSPITFAYAGGSIQITNGSASGGSSIGGYVAGYAGGTLADGGNTNGNAAQSQVLGGLNSYLGTVLSSRPSGPVTVNALTTSSTTPTITGSATLAAGENLTVLIGGIQYSTSSTPAIVLGSGSWSLSLATSLAVGTHEVSATITNANGFTLNDATSNELTIAAPASTVTIGGSFTATNKSYDGTVAAAGVTSGLTLTGVSGGHDVTIASVSLAFQNATAGSGKTVVISGVTLAGANAGSYSVSLAGAPTATANITAKALTITGVGAASRVYDGTTVATLTGTAAYAGLATGESFAVSGAPVASFDSASVGTSKAVTVSGYVVPTANYTLSQPTGLSANVTAKSLTIGGSFTAASKPFDNTTWATITADSFTLIGKVGSDVVSLTSATAAFATAGVAVAKTVSLTGACLAGADASNYTLSMTGAPTTTADITAPGGTVTIGGSFTATNKSYDGTVAATGTTSALTLAGVTSPDQVTIASVSFAFQSATAGSGKTVIISGVTLAGANAGSYSVSLAGAPTTTASITATPLTIAGVTAADKTYDGTTAALLVGTPAYVGLANGETFAVSGTPVANFATASVGVSKAVTVAGYTTPSANYTVTQPTGLTASVSAKSLAIGGSFTAADKTFDGSSDATVTSSSLTPVGSVGSDVVAIACVTAAFADSAVGNGKPVHLTAAMISGDGSGNYAVTVTGAPTTTASITAVVTPPSGGTVTIGGSFTANDKTYDGTTAATGATSGLTLVGVQAPDDVTITSVTMAFQDVNVGDGKQVIITGVTLGGANAAAYSVTVGGAPTATARIIPKALTIGGTFIAADKEYDGARAATITTNRLVPLGAVRDGDVSIGGAIATFADATVGAGKTVSLTGVVLAGPGASNYVLSMVGTPTTSARITARGLTVGGAFTAADKRFDGTTAATITSSSLTPLGVRAGDVIALEGVVATFADAVIGTSKPVTLVTARLAGAASANYTLSLAGAPRTTAAITAAAPPSAPRNVAAIAGNGSIAVTWARPELEGCSAITGFHVEYSTNATAGWTRVTVASSAAAAAELQGLVNNAPHRVRVAAFNACGTSGFAEASTTVTPVGPTRTSTGSPVSNAPGTVTVNSGGVLRPGIVEVVQDTTLQLTAGDITLTVRSRDSAGVAIAADSVRALELDHGGTVTAQGRGFEPGTLVTVYIYSTTGAPVRLGEVGVAPDGSFAATLPIPGSLPPGNHTLQVNGVDREYVTRSVTVGVTVAEPPAVLVLTAEPDQQSPAVGDTITITITVTNTGAGRAIDVVIPRAFSEAGFKVITATALEGAYDNARQTWTIARIDPGARARMRLTVVVLPSALSHGNTP